ncbi:MAG: BamA/TamA family outer membrane protein [Candidatus Krumholzibacteria bacterium]|nr:BamA/TamA family outer membrane protein [Candidatus Krumholzibacteria bacterium]
MRGSAARIDLFLLLALLLVGWLLPEPARADDELDFGLETHRLAAIEISGNETFTTDELKNLLRIQEASWTRPLHIPRYQPHLVATQVRLLKSYYRNRGFHDVEAGLDSISTIPDEGDVLHISIIEGDRTFIRQVSFTGNEPMPEARLREVMSLLEGSPAPADLNAYGGDIYSLLTLYRNETYLEARVVPELTIEPYEDESGRAADVVYRINPGQAHHVGEISLAGNDITNDNIILREMEIRPGETLRWDQIENSRRNLLNTALFRDVTILPIAADSLSGQTDLVVRVIERKPAFYEFGAGVGSLERVRLLAAWGHRNLWGTARRLEVRGRGSWNLEDVIDYSPTFDQGQINYRADLRYVNPRLRDSRYSFDWEVYMKRETRGESGLNMFGYGTNVGTSWQASQRVRNSVFLGYKVTDPEVHPLAPDDIKDRFAEVDPQADQVRSVNWVNFIDHRDDLFRPSAGMYTIGTAQLAGGLMGGDYSFFKWTAAWHNYHQTFLGGVVALRFKVGGTTPYGKSRDRGADGVPYDDRFFAGGGSTVRGYGHNTLGPQIVDQDELDDLNFSSDVLLPDNPARGGNYLMLTNLEWRFPMPVLHKWKFASVLFFEGGNVWEQLGDVRMRAFRLTSNPGDPTDPGSTKVWDYRYSFGTGIRLDTPVGPVRVDVGFPLKRVNYVSDIRNYKDPSVVWHFSLGYPF